MKTQHASSHLVEFPWGWEAAMSVRCAVWLKKKLDTFKNALFSNQVIDEQVVTSDL